MPQTVIRFEEFELDTARCQLRRSGKPQKLERIPMELLTLLVENRGKVVSREAIVDRLWGKDVFLETEHSINTAINKIRRVLRDNPGNPRFVQTVFGRGYRFLPETTVVPEAASADAAVAANPSGGSAVLRVPASDATDRVTTSMPSASSASVSGKIAEKDASQEEPSLIPSGIPPAGPIPNNAKRHGLAWPLVAVIVSGALLYLTVRFVRSTSMSGAQLANWEVHSIAVLPLTNLSNNPEQEYLVDGMTDQLITDLARATSLRVISRTSTMQYKGVHKSLPEIARDLNVDAIIEGSVLPSQGQVRITAQLLDARRDRHLWAESYERGQQDLLAMQDEVARDIAREIAATLQPVHRVVHEQNVGPEAYDQYLHGRFLWNRRTLGDLEKSIRYYQQAIQLAPNFAPAYSALGDAYAVISIRGGPPPSESYPRAREAAEKALQLDDSLADAHALLAEVRVNYDHDWEDGEKEFQRAVALNPNYPTAHQWYSAYLVSMKRPQEAESEIDKASILDPLSMMIKATRCEIRYLARDPDSAIKISLHAQELDPNFAETYLCLGKGYEQQGQLREASANFKRAVDLSKGAPGMLMLQAHAYALAGRKDLAADIVHRTLSSNHGYLANSDVAAVYLQWENRPWP